MLRRPGAARATGRMRGGLQRAEKGRYPGGRWGCRRLSPAFLLPLRRPSLEVGGWSANPDIPFALMAGDPGCPTSPWQSGVCPGRVAARGATVGTTADPSLSSWVSPFGAGPHESHLDSEPRPACAVLLCARAIRGPFPVSGGLEGTP